MSDATSSFARLASDARNGSRDALGELLERLRPYMLSVANDLVDSQLRPKCSGSDLVQDASIKATRHFRDFDGQSERELLRWVVAIIKHRMVDVHRAYVTSAKRRVGAEQPLETINRLNPLAADETANRERRTANLLVQIDRLPEPARQIVMMHHEDGLSFAEIGRRLEISHESARLRWYAALKELGRNLLDDHE